MFALEIETSYALAVDKAKSQNKPILLVVTQNNCAWCEKLKKETLESPKISQILSKEYVVVAINKDRQKLPSGVTARLAPTSFLLNHEQKQLDKPLVGFFSADIYEDFLLDGVMALKNKK